MSSKIFSNLGAATWGDVATAGTFSLLQAGIGYFSAKNSADTEYRNQQRNFKLRVQQANRETAATNRGIRADNAYALYEHGIRKQMSKDQMAFNASAANIAYISEQQRINEITTAFAFRNEAMRGQFMEAQGYNAALNEGNRGASFERAAAVNTAGNYGRAMQQAFQGLLGEQRASRGRMDQIALQQYGADLQADAMSRTLPYLKREIDPINPGRGPQRTFNSGLQIANALGGASMNTLGMLM